MYVVFNLCRETYDGTGLLNFRGVYVLALYIKIYVHFVRIKLTQFLIMK